ncbi:hypothetical protein Nepgr_007207 [Nepenthes gracilis]|uniref:FYVE-type domain-containing protein n=1 Tax=Nepenthes gracilis TaxID=150966 RepID=A0AAD3XI23_NEPGR|nr:hypothetical protein Nepgr_007207 [Nepenthes gracilis]
MLEKIGLPAKPSLRGNTWVVDASHCQGCSSQFTFINRKHHCRRCGGLFCNSCTVQRMILRGQGDSPVRICEPCKKLEEATRFEQRHGHKNRADRGTLKLASREEDEVLNQLLENEGKEPFASGRDVKIGGRSSSVPGSSIQEVATLNGEEDAVRKSSVHEPNDVCGEVESASPEKLRQQALDEKNNYKILKGKGKSAEALRAFKRAKELERQAAALEVQMRKNRRKAFVSSSTAEMLKNEDGPQESDKQNKPSPEKGKEKDDLASELKALGWSDMDLHDADKKPATTSLERELFSLMGENSRRDNGKNVAHETDKTEVVALKRKALTLKREGKLAEAKEELKKAKILEKKLEEEEFLAEAEDSDDELTSLIRSLDSGKQDDLSIGSGLEFDKLVDYSSDGDVVGPFEVTDNDMDDPELIAALESLGWTEESNITNKDVPLSVPVDKEMLAREVLNLKKEALNQKQLGNVAEAMSFLKKAKLLEKDLDSFVLSPADSSILTDAEKVHDLNRIDGGSTKVMTDVGLKPSAKSRTVIQRELLGLKRKAFALRREGKIDEAEEELKKGKILEQQLEEMDNAAKMRITQVNVSDEVSELSGNHPNLSTALESMDEVEGNVTNQDMHDPAYLTLLKSLGWQDEDDEHKMSSAEVSKQNTISSIGRTHASPGNSRESRSKAEIQRELLGLKRKAFALRRQGQAAEAEELLEKAKVLEAQMAEVEAPVEILVGFSEHLAERVAPKKEAPLATPEAEEDANGEPPVKRPTEARDDAGNRKEPVNLTPNISTDIQSSAQQEIVAHKRKALVLKREGKLAEAREELRKAKLLERTLEEHKSKTLSSSAAMELSISSAISNTQEEPGPSNVAPRPLSSHDRFKLQQECLSHKRNAFKLRREGHAKEAEAELQLARALEVQLEEFAAHDPTHSTPTGMGPADDSGVEDFLDPELLSALRAIGLQDAHGVSNTPAKVEPSMPDSQKTESSSNERVQLEAQIKAEKVRALNLKRSGKQAEALDVLRHAKQLEKKLNSLL